MPVRSLHPFHAPEERPDGRRSRQRLFQDHIDLLHVFLAHRDDIAEKIQALLNAQRKPIEYLRDSSRLSADFEDCFFRFPGVGEGYSRLRGELEEAHWTGAFKPRDMPGMYNGLADPAEIIIRAFHLWQQTRWPGRSGRVRYAQTLFNLYFIRRLELLSLRLWDAESASVADRLAQVQGVLDQLRLTTSADQPVFVRDARWLIQLAQSPATDDLGAYFLVAQKIADTFPTEQRLEIHKAGVQMTAGHLRSQLRHLSVTKAVSFDDASLLLGTRTSNALDFALMVQDLVPLLEAYERACETGNVSHRRELADAICQGLSADPELFVNRVALLRGYTMIEHLFIDTKRDEQIGYTPMGERHVRLLGEYEALIGRLSTPLSDDCSRFRPVSGGYSPFGVLYGFTSHLIEHMALKASQPDALTRYSLEDVFVSGDVNGDKLNWVSGWRKLPHLTREVERQFDFPQQFAEGIFARLEHALSRRAADDGVHEIEAVGRLFVVHSDAARDDSPPPSIPDLPVRYLSASDLQVVSAKKAVFCDEARLASDGREGKVLVSYDTPDGSVALTKDILTEVLGAGRDAKIAGLPLAAAKRLKLMCPDLVRLPEDDSAAPAGEEISGSTD